jgi:hypothetical protein
MQNNRVIQTKLSNGLTLKKLFVRISKRYIVLMLIFFNCTFMQGSGVGENSPLLRIKEQLTEDNAKNMDLGDYINIEKEKMRVEQEKIYAEIKKKKDDRKKIEATLIAGRNQILWNCHRHLSNITANKDENISTLKFVLAQIYSMQTFAEEEGVSASIHSIIRYRHGCYYCDRSVQLGQIDRLVNPQKYYFYPYSPGNEKVRSAMVTLKNCIEKFLREHQK